MSLRPIPVNHTKPGSRYLMMVLLAVAAMAMFFALQAHRLPSHHTSVSPATSPAPAGSTSPGGADDHSAQPPPSGERNG